MTIQSQIANRKSQIRRGFSFVELMFAVMILGIGFIMIAAVFPVGLQQVKTSLDESAAAQNARGSVAMLEQVGQSMLQYLNPASPIDATNSTSVFPVTHALTYNLPTIAQLPTSGQSVTLPGTVRSLRDTRFFSDTALTAANPNMDPANATARRNYLWSKIAGDLLNRGDDRNAGIVLYKRDVIATNNAGAITAAPTGSAQLIIVNAQATSQSYFTLNNVAPTLSQDLCNLEPRPVGVNIYYNSTEGVWLAQFSSAKGLTDINGHKIGNFGTATAATLNSELDAIPNGEVGEGMFVVIADDQITAPFFDIGRMNGRIMRIGVSRNDIGPGVWQLSPGYEMTIDPGASGAFNDASKDDIAAIGYTGMGTTGTINGTAYDGSNVQSTGPALAYVLGRGFSDNTVTPTAPAGYTGAVQDVAAYTTFVTVP